MKKLILSLLVGSLIVLDAEAVDVRTAECFVALCRRPLTGLAIIFR